MISPNAFRKLLVTSAIGGLFGIGIGCVIGGVDCNECGESSLCHSHTIPDQDGDGVAECECDEGYVFSNPGDPNDFDCEMADDPKPGTSDCVEPNSFLAGDNCYCDSGYDWCTTDPDDFTCCAVGGSGGDDGSAGDDGVTSTAGDDDSGSGDPSGDETGAAVCSEDPPPFIGDEPDAAACDAEAEGGFWCTNSVDQGPAGSLLYVCESGAWVEHPELLQEDCEFQGFQFPLGCVDDGTDVVILCGDGPGTDCSGEGCDECADADVLNFCADGKLQSAGCAQFCMEVGIDGVTFESGYCTAEDVDGPTCACCDSDSGDENCPV